MSKNPLWDEVENTETKNNNYTLDENSKDFSSKEYRELLINNLVKYSKENKIVNELFIDLSLGIKDMSKEDKEAILEVFTESSNLLNSTNTYLKNPIKGMKLISDIIRQDNKKDKSKLELKFEEFDSFIKHDFIEFSSQVSIENEAELYSQLMAIRDELFDDIKFFELVNKTHIGIGGSFSAGKSSFLNSILDRDINAEDILPIDSVPTTSIPTYIVKKAKFETNNPIDIYTFNKDGNKSKIDRDSLLAISHEFNKVYGFGLTSVINKIVVDVASMPFENIAFLDTPGYSKADGKLDVDKNIAKEHLRNIDSMIWLIDADNGIIRDGDIKFIQSLDFKGDILFVLNKADKKPLSDVKSIINAIKETLGKANISYVDVMAYSSHDKVEYFSSNIIEKFLSNRNKAKAISFELKAMSVIYQYGKHLDVVESKSSKMLEFFNKLDLYNAEIDIDNFDEILLNIREDKSKNKKDIKSYEKISSSFLKILIDIDSMFNTKISKEVARNRSNYISLNKIQNSKLKTKNDYLSAIETYTEAINININKKFENKEDTFWNSTLKVLNKTTNAFGVNLNLDDEKNFYQRANCYKALNKYEDAIADYSKAITLSSDIEEYYIKRAECYSILNNHKKAFFDYEKLIELNPQYEKWYKEKKYCEQEIEREQAIQKAKNKVQREKVYIAIDNIFNTLKSKNN